MTRNSERLVCLVAPGQLSATPRLVKEADALIASGYRVHAITLDHFPANRARDEEILAHVEWTATRIQPDGGVFGVARRLLQRGAQRMPNDWLARFDALAARSKEREIGKLTRAARQTEADYYVGHCLAALPVVAGTARERGVRFGLDLEDFHEAETTDIERDSKQQVVARSLLGRHLPNAAHLTAASPLIAEAYERSYGVSPTVVLNVFPLNYAPAARIDPGPVSGARPAVLYWVSQTIGPGRGIEEIVAALAYVRTPVELHLRGHVAPGYTKTLAGLTRRLGCRHAIRFLPFSSPREVVRLAAAADLGLSTEQTTPLNRALCLTNKVFIYLLAGVPQLLSETPAQSALAPALGQAGRLFQLGEPHQTAAVIDAFFSSPERIATARRQAWDLGQTRYHWELENELFVRAVQRAIVN